MTEPIEDKESVRNQNEKLNNNNSRDEECIIDECYECETEYIIDSNFGPKLGYECCKCEC